MGGFSICFSEHLTGHPIKQRISQLDEKAVERATIQLGYAKEDLATAKSYNAALVEKYNDLKERWNAIWQEPEMVDAWRRVETRKKQDAEERLNKKPKQNVKEKLDSSDT